MLFGRIEVPSQLQLIVGLGNPGGQYEATRHNAGFWFVDALAAKYGGIFSPEAKFKGEVCKLTIEGQSLLLLKPTTFMNRSGDSVRALKEFYKLEQDSMLVVHDELDLLPGTARFKKGGGHGGHNGLRSIIANCGGPDFLRLRIGIGHPGNKDQVVNFVLHKPSLDELTLIQESLEAALDVFPLLMRGDMAKAMNQLHSKR